jgi:hypothetical protein
VGRQVVLLGAVVAVLALPAATATGAGTPPTGDGHGLQLLAVVHHAYLHVPAVSIAGKTGGFSFRFTLVLRSGVGVAEQFVGKSKAGTTKLVAPSGPVTYARDPGRTCWRRVPESDPQSFDNVGMRFPDHAGMRVKKPRRASGGAWQLPAVVGGQPGVLLVDGKTAIVRTITVTAGSTSIVEHVRSLASAPKLAVPKPRC